MSEVEKIIGELDQLANWFLGSSLAPPGGYAGCAELIRSANTRLRESSPALSEGEGEEGGSSRDHAPATGSALEEWRRPPPHFKPDHRWQRQPQSAEGWDRHQDPMGDGGFRAKRRLAFAGDKADPRAPLGMALVSRWDVILALSRLSWLEARFENTRETMLPPVQCNTGLDAVPGMTQIPIPPPPDKDGQSLTVEEVARMILAEVSNNDPDELIHHPAAKSWEAPAMPRWEQFADVAQAIIDRLRSGGPIQEGGQSLAEAEIKWAIKANIRARHEQDSVGRTYSWIEGEEEAAKALLSRLHYRGLTPEGDR